MAELLRNPKTMAKAQAEMEDVVGPNGVVQESHISDLPYLQAVVKETLRLHPPGPLLAPHKAETNVEVLGFLMPKNAQVLVNAWYIGRDSSIWENAERFEPQRFLSAREIDVKGRDFELIPFGAGRRICPGMSVAMKTVPLILASLLHSLIFIGSFKMVSFLRIWTWTRALVLLCIRPIHFMQSPSRNVRMVSLM